MTQRWRLIEIMLPEKDGGEVRERLKEHKDGGLGTTVALTLPLRPARKRRAT